MRKDVAREEHVAAVAAPGGGVGGISLSPAPSAPGYRHDAAAAAYGGIGGGLFFPASPDRGLVTQGYQHYAAVPDSGMAAAA